MTKRRGAHGFMLAAALSLAAIGSLIPGESLVRAAGPAMKTYVNTKFNYSMSYPTNWINTKSKTENLLVTSADTNSFVDANAVTGTASAAQIKAKQKSSLASLGTAGGKLSYSVKSINGVNFQTSEQVRKGPKGQLLDLLVLDVVRNGNLYDFGAGVALGKSTTAAQTKQVQAILNSVKFK